MSDLEKQVRSKYCTIPCLCKQAVNQQTCDKEDCNLYVAN